MFGKRERTVRRILIVEDEPLVAFDNEHFLNDAGYEVIATVDAAKEAIRQIERTKPDLVLSDIALHDDGTGIDVARRAKALDVPLVFVTAACPAEGRDLAIGCLAKPYSQRDLLATIEAVDALLQGRRPKRVPKAFAVFGDKSFPKPGDGPQA